MRQSLLKLAAVTLLLTGITTAIAQEQAEVYDFEMLAPDNNVYEYESMLDETPIEVPGYTSGENIAVYKETATFCGTSLNGRFAFEKDADGNNKFVLTATNGLYIQGGKNNIWAIMGLKKGEIVHVEYNNTSKKELQVVSGNVAWLNSDGTLVDLTGKTGKGGKNDSRILATGQASYDFIMQADGNISFCTGTSFKAYLRNVTITPKTANKVAYIFDSSHPNYNAEADLTHTIMGIEDFVDPADVEDIDLATATLDAEQLLQKHLVVIGPFVKASEPQAATLKSLIAYVPMLNMSTSLYETWGYGKPVVTKTDSLLIDNTARHNSLFFERDGTAMFNNRQMMPFLEEGSVITAFDPIGTYFANDRVLAWADSTMAIHMHNEKRNAYMLLPYDCNTGSDYMGSIIGNAISILIKTRRDIVAADAPTYTLDYQKRQTIVTLNSNIQSATIYYTTDGKEPTTEDNIFTEPIVINEENIVIKAIAVAEGYLVSPVLTTDVIDLRYQVETPAIAIEQASDVSVVTLTCETTNAQIYYNYTGSAQTKESALYEGPVTLNRHATITAFAQAEGMVQSELQQKMVRVNGETIRIDTLAWMNGHDECYGNSTLVEEYDYDPGNLTYQDFGNGWAYGSYGQRVIVQPTSGGSMDVGAGNYGPATVDDWGYSIGCISFQFCKKEEDPSSAWLQTTNKIQGPFDIYIWMTGQINPAWNNLLEVSVSADSINWQVVDTLITNQKKNQEKHIRSYEGNDDVYVKVRCVNNDEGTKVSQKTNVNDILLLGHGPLSEAFEQAPTGISTISSEQNIYHIDKVYDLHGIQLERMKKGINIIVETDANGTVRTRKVMMR